MKKQHIRRLSTTRITSSPMSIGIEAVRFRFKKAATAYDAAGRPYEHVFEEDAVLLLTPSGKMWLTEVELRRVIRALQETDVRVGVPLEPRACEEQRKLQEVVA